MFAILYVGVLMLLITGLIGLPGLYNFIWDFNMGGCGFFCIRNFMCFLSMIRLHCCRVFSSCLWSLLVGVFFEVCKSCFLLGRYAFFLEYLSEHTIQRTYTSTYRYKKHSGSQNRCS